jgi:hypothetical protein
MPRVSTSIFLWTACVILLWAGTACREAPQPALDDPSGTPNALFPVEQNDRWGYITRDGRLAIEPQYDRAYRFVDNRALIRRDGRFGFIDTTGSTVIPAEYADAWHFSEGLAPVQRDSLWGFIDRSGDMAVDPQFNLAPSVVEETQHNPTYRRTRIDGQVGYRNAEGSLVIPPAFDQAWYFSEGRARIRTDGKWGYIDRSGEVVVPPRFEQAWDVRNGLARVRLPDGRMGYVTRAGTLVWPPDAAD